MSYSAQTTFLLMLTFGVHWLGIKGLEYIPQTSLDIEAWKQLEKIFDRLQPHTANSGMQRLHLKKKRGPGSVALELCAIQLRTVSFSKL